ncbi:hypothetical protein BGZ73_003534 [Actinomortierella ambigua]|nr:hypothetical protein BGZ73_003534 [Actinomortierella ambigua]
MASTGNDAFSNYDAQYSESGALPPSYEEAIAQYEQSLTSDERQRQRILQQQRQQQEPRPPSMDLQPEDHDAEDEEAYNESRPLRQGTVPSTFAQVTNAPAVDLPVSSSSMAAMGATAGLSQAYAPAPSMTHPHLHHPPHPSLSHAQFGPHVPPLFGPSFMSPPGSVPDPSTAPFPMSPIGAPFPPPGPFPFHGPPPMGPFPVASGSGTASFHSDAKPSVAPPSAPPAGTSSSSSSSSSAAASATPTSLSSAGAPAATSASSPPPSSSTYYQTPERETIKAADISMAMFERTKDGVESEDPILEDPYQLYRFLVAHNDRPSLHVLITGHHTERRQSTTTDKDGHHSTTTYTAKVEDFKITFDLSEYVSTVGTLYTVANPKTGRKLTLREAMEEYAQDENAFKEFHMEKHVIWDYEELKKAITHAIRSVHYRYTIEISFPTQNNKVIVRSASPAATFMRNTWTKVFCFVTLIGVIAYPLRACYRRIKDKSVRSSFNVNLSPRDFYNMHYWDIVNAVQYK